MAQLPSMPMSLNTLHKLYYMAKRKYRKGMMIAAQAMVNFHMSEDFKKNKERDGIVIIESYKGQYAE